MPTGYTAILLEKDDVTFKEFVLRCARGMGACLEMRDEPLDVPPPRSVEVSSYYLDVEKQARKDLADLNALTQEERVQKHQEFLNRRLEGEAKHNLLLEENNAKFLSMIEKVKAWVPPSPDHENFKKFMLEQLEISLWKKFDSWVDIERNFASKDCEGWFIQQRVELQRRVSSSEKAHKEECARVAETNLWLSQLWASLENGENND